METVPKAVKKNVVQLGDGGQKPSHGDMVSFHRTLLTPDDCVIISSYGDREYQLPMDKNRMPEALFRALSDMTVNEISWFPIDSSSTPNYGQENCSEPEVVGQLTRGGKCVIKLLDIQTGKQKHSKGKQAQIGDVVKENPNKQPKLLAAAMKASVGQQPKKTEKEKQARECKGKGKIEDLERASLENKSEEKAAEKKHAAGLEKAHNTLEYLFKAEDLEKAETRRSLIEASKPAADVEKAPKNPDDLEKAETSAPRYMWLNRIGLLIWIKIWIDRVSGWVSRQFNCFKRVVTNKVFIKGLQFIVFGSIILADKIRFLDQNKYPIKYRVLLGSGIFSVLFGFGVSICFPRVGANFLIFISFVEIWIGGLGYLA